MVVQRQILNKILDSENYDIVKDNNLTLANFPDYQEEFEFIDSYYNKYGATPTIETVLNNFPNFNTIKVTESDTFLIEQLESGEDFRLAKGILETGADLAKKDPKEAIRYLAQQAKTLEIKSLNTVMGVDIISQAKDRLNTFLDRNVDNDFTTTGFKELDEILSGFHFGEELVTVFARTNEGKSFLLIKMLEAIFNQGHRVGLLTPEMSAERVGYRFDSADGGFSNKGLIRGDRAEEAEYKEYINNLSRGSGFNVVVRKDFPNKKVTVSAIRDWAITNNLEAIGIDGIAYMTDERPNYRDNESDRLGHIADDLMDLSTELGIPIIIVVQANRDGADKATKADPTPDLESIRGSDAVAHSSSKVISLGSRDTILYLKVVKNRDGIRDIVLKYSWNPDRAEYIYIPDNEHIQDSEQMVEDNRNKYRGEESLF